jgi:hypothetical protein
MSWHQRIGWGALLALGATTIGLSFHAWLERRPRPAETPAPADMCADILSAMQSSARTSGKQLDVDGPTPSIRARCLESMSAFQRREQDSYGCAARCVRVHHDDVPGARGCLKTCNAPPGTDAFIDGAMATSAP